MSKMAERGSGDCLNCPFGTAQDRDLFDFGMGMILEVSREHCRFFLGRGLGKRTGPFGRLRTGFWIPAGAGMTALAREQTMPRGDSLV